MKKILLFLLLFLFLSCESVENKDDFNQEEFLSKQNYIKNLKGCSFDYSVGGYMPHIIAARVKQGEPNNPEVLELNGFEKEHYDGEKFENLDYWDYLLSENSQYIFASLDELYSFVLSEMNEYKDRGYSIDCSIKWNKEHDYVFDSICVRSNRKRKGIVNNIIFDIHISNFVCEQ